MTYNLTICLFVFTTQSAIVRFLAASDILGSLGLGEDLFELYYEWKVWLKLTFLPSPSVQHIQPALFATKDPQAVLDRPLLTVIHALILQDCVLHLLHA